MDPSSSASGQAAPSSGMSITTYLLEHVIGQVHLRDRLAMQRFIASLLLAAWPPLLTDLTIATADLQSRIQTCLTNVTYYEEILGKLAEIAHMSKSWACG